MKYFSELKPGDRVLFSSASHQVHKIAHVRRIVHWDDEEESLILEFKDRCTHAVTVSSKEYRFDDDPGSYWSSPEQGISELLELGYISESRAYKLSQELWKT